MWIVKLRPGVHLHVVNHVLGEDVWTDFADVEDVLAGLEQGRSGQTLEREHQLQVLVVVGVKDVQRSDVPGVREVWMQSGFDQHL